MSTFTRKKPKKWENDSKIKKRIIKKSERNQISCRRDKETEQDYFLYLQRYLTVKAFQKFIDQKLFYLMKRLKPRYDKIKARIFKIFVWTFLL